MGRPGWGVAGPGDLPDADESEAVRTIHRALDLGINFFDTAPNYGYRESERVFGKALRGRRSRFFIATKCGHFYSAQTNYTKDHTPALSSQSIDDSLRTLGVETIDLIQIHSAPLQVILKGEVLQVLRRAQQAGKVRFIGVTTDDASDAEVCRAAILDGGYDALQVTYNLLRRDLAATGVLNQAAAHGVGVIVKSPLGTGACTYKFASLPEARKQERDRIARVGPVAEKAGMSLAQIAVRYILSNPDIATVIAGTRRPGHVEENAAAGDGKGLSEEVAREVETALA